jgi:hypothetical protein
MRRVARPVDYARGKEKGHRLRPDGVRQEIQRELGGG